MRELHLPLATTLRMIAWRQRIVALLRILCGCLCAFDACYRWLALQGTGYLLRIVHEQPLPGWLMPWFTPWLSIAQLPPHLFAICIAAAETVVACALICGALTNLVCMLAISLTLLGWIGNTGTGALTMFFRPGYFDLGIMLVSILIFLGLCLSNAGQPYGVDLMLSSKLGRWSFLASRSNSSLISARSHTSNTFSLPAVPTLTLTHTNMATQSFLVESEAHTTHSAHAPKERQRVLFM